MNRTNLIQSPDFITHLNLYGLNSIFIKANDGSSTKESEFFFFFFWQIGSGRQKQTTCMQERYSTGGTKGKKKMEVRFFKPVSDYSLVFNASANTSV